MASLLVFGLVVAAIALFGVKFTPGPWYESLAKPAWTPPDPVFGPVWTVLYACIAVAGWRVRESGLVGARSALGLWIAQLLLNGLWSWLFFGLQRPGLALVDIGLLLAIIAAFLVRARNLDTLAFWLFVPYGVWVSYAAALNLAIWLGN